MTNNKEDFSLLGDGIKKLVIERDGEMIATIYRDRVDRYGGVTIRLFPEVKDESGRSGKETRHE